MTNERLTRLREFFHRLRSLFRAKQLDTELDAEMAAHLELAIEENLQRGMDRQSGEFGELLHGRVASLAAARALLICRNIHVVRPHSGLPGWSGQVAADRHARYLRRAVSLA